MKRDGNGDAFLPVHSSAFFAATDLNRLLPVGILLRLYCKDSHNYTERKVGLINRLLTLLLGELLGTW